MFTDNDWTSHNIPVWNQTLASIKGIPMEMIEVGCFEGRSTVWFLENVLYHPNSHITCIDPFISEQELKDVDWTKIKHNFLTNTRPYKSKVTLVQKESAQYLKKRTQLADLVYIDGSHLAKDVLVDSVLVHLLLKPHGIVIFDDYLWGGLEKSVLSPKSAIDSFMDNFAREYNLLSMGYQVILQKK